jgi:hypothetical protein
MKHQINGLLVLAAIALLPARLSAQVPDWYPWHNRVLPEVNATIAIDSRTGDFIYRYMVANGPGAEQRIAVVYMELTVPAVSVAAPRDWKSSYAPPPPDVQWWASGTIDPAWVEAHSGDVPSFLSEIAAGASLEGFEIRHPCAAGGLVTYYIQGYNHVTAVPAEYEGPLNIPTWREDAVKGTVVGPGDCSEVRDWGNRRPGVDGFVGLVNFYDGASLPEGPVAVQLRFSRSGEVVDRGTLRVEMNRVDVTAAFRTNSRGDAVAVFAPGSSPLVGGRNVLLVSVEGLVPGTQRRAADVDRFTFRVP